MKKTIKNTQIKKLPLNNKEILENFARQLQIQYNKIISEKSAADNTQATKIRIQENKKNIQEYLAIFKK